MVARRVTRIPPYVRRKIVNLRVEKTGRIRKRLIEDGLQISCKGIRRVIQCFNLTGGIGYMPHPPKLSKITPEIESLIERKMEEESSITAVQLQKLILDTFNVQCSIHMIGKARRRLGYVQTSTRYCQMIKQKNKPLHLLFAAQCVANNEQYDDIIFTNESTFKVESHSVRSFRKKNKPKPMKPKPKHPYQVHVWGGISKRGTTTLAIFTGRMNSLSYQEILRRHLLPFIQQSYPQSHRLWQDNDPKHVSRSTRRFLTENNINHFPTPAESPDMNPI